MMKFFHPFIIVLTISGCKTVGEQAPENQNPGLKVVFSDNRAVPDENGLVEVEVTFLGLPSSSSLIVTRNGGGYGNVNKYGVGILSEKFMFQYAIHPDDPQETVLEFQLMGKDGRPGPVSKLTIDNTSGKKFTTLTFSDFKVVSRVTGKEDNGHDGLPKVAYEVFNNTHTRFDVGGTDLGITWEISPGKFGMVFGDTFGGDFVPNLTAPNPGGSNWRGNVLLFSEDTRLSDGLSITGAATDSQGRAREICYSAHITDGNSDYTSIPTGAVHAGGADYIHYMNIRTWYGWVSNFSSYFKSTDGARTWNRVRSISFASRSNFGQVGLFNHEGYVYMIGTVTGRSSNPRLARVVEDRVEHQDEYEYWSGLGWVRDKETAAAPIFDDFSGELSFAWFPQHRKWVILYINEQRNDQIIMRYADNIIGPWSEPQVLTDGRSFWRPYGSFIHPLSLKEGNDLYFIMSAWNAYNTYLIHGKLN
jgi:hypothetical protein